MSCQEYQLWAPATDATQRTSRPCFRLPPYIHNCRTQQQRAGEHFGRGSVRIIYNNLGGRFWSASVPETAAHDILHNCRCGVHSFSLLVPSRTPSASLSRGVSHDALCPLSQEPDQMPKYVLAEFLAAVSQTSLLKYARLSAFFACTSSAARFSATYVAYKRHLCRRLRLHSPITALFTPSYAPLGVRGVRVRGSARPRSGGYFLADIHPPQALNFYTRRPRFSPTRPGQRELRPPACS